MCLKARLTSTLYRHPLPSLIIWAVMSSIEGKVNMNFVPMYSSEFTKSFTELPLGQLRSTITRLFSESGFSLVINGLQCKLSKGFSLKGPCMGLKPFSSCK